MFSSNRAGNKPPTKPMLALVNKLLKRHKGLEPPSDMGSFDCVRQWIDSALIDANGSNKPYHGSTIDYTDTLDNGGLAREIGLYANII